MVTLRKSANVDVGTPRDFFLGVSAVFGAFDLDVCCNPPATMPLAPRFYTPSDDGLAQSWSLPEIQGRVTRAWCNPPYGDEAAWIVKGATESAFSAHLVPVKSSMAWWIVAMRRAAIVLFVKGRLRFAGMQWDAGFASALVVFDPAARKNGQPIIGAISKQGVLL